MHIFVVTLAAHLFHHNIDNWTSIGFVFDIFPSQYLPSLFCLEECCNNFSSTFRSNFIHSYLSTTFPKRRRVKSNKNMKNLMKHFVCNQERTVNSNLLVT